MTQDAIGGAPQWDGESLSAWLATGSGAVLCRIDREAINRIARYDDAIGIEIGRYRGEIFDLLGPVFLAKARQRAGARSNGSVVRLSIQDIDRAGLSRAAASPPAREPVSLGGQL